jgi:hypothetical protein
MTSERIDSIINALKNTTAYNNGAVDYVDNEDCVVVYNTFEDYFMAINVIYALNPFVVKIKAWKSKVYLEVK